MHSVTLPGSGPPLSSRPALANGHAPSAKKSAPAKTVSFTTALSAFRACLHARVTFSHCTTIHSKLDHRGGMVSMSSRACNRVTPDAARLLPFQTAATTSSAPFVLPFACTHSGRAYTQVPRMLMLRSRITRLLLACTCPLKACALMGHLAAGQQCLRGQGWSDQQGWQGAGQQSQGSHTREERCTACR